jgi:type II secretory pathway component GspD/PulD (secretin)
MRWLALLLCALGAAALAQSLEVIDLQHRTAEEIIPVLRPLLEPGGALSGKDYKLFVRASAANVKQLRQALAQLDRQPRQLFVSERRSTQQEN